MMCSFALHVSSLGKCVYYLPIEDEIVFLVVYCNNSLCILDTGSLQDSFLVLHTFLPILWLAFLFS